jgi:hypothetical protein
MKTWQKITVVCVCGAVVWGLSYTSSLFPAYALVCSSFATGFTALSSIITGWPANPEA